jgi:hypothetical protein
MSEGVEFEEDKRTYTRQPGAPVSFSGGNNFTEKQYSPNGSEPKMVQWLLRHGYAKTPTSANVILLIVVAINIAIAYFVITSFL